MSNNTKSTHLATNNIDDIPTNAAINLEVVEKVITKSHDAVVDKAHKTITDNIKKKSGQENKNQITLLSKSKNEPKIPEEEERHSYKQTREFIIFKNELDALIHNNLSILKECKSTKRLLDIKYSELNTYISYIQISVIVLSTISGFLQSTKNYFATTESIVSVSGITISTYISLILSVSKYYKFDEQKERIHNLQEKYANLHNKIEYRMDILGPHTKEELWEHRDVVEKLTEWSKIKIVMDEEYLTLIETKQALTTEFESIMDSKSRNENYIKDRTLVLHNRRQLFNTLVNHNKLEEEIKTKNISTDFTSAIQLPDDDLNNWDDPA
jgi:hypothetical protein